MKWPFSAKQTGIGILVVIFLLALLGWRAGCAAAQRAEREANQAQVVGDQLDKTSTKSEAVRQEQQEQEREVDKIEGADQPLPPGFGAELERVRRGRRD